MLQSVLPDGDADVLDLQALCLKGVSELVEVGLEDFLDSRVFDQEPSMHL
jgi:hypothetical protein